MYKILLKGKRYNSLKFPTYEDARRYVRRKVSQMFGKYSDGYTAFGFTIVPIK